MNIARGIRVVATAGVLLSLMGTSTMAAAQAGSLKQQQDDDEAERRFDEAIAQTEQAIAKRRYQEGLRFVAQKKFAEAAESFQHAYQAKPDQRYLWNAALARVRANQPYDALLHLRSYVKAPDADPKNLPRAEVLIEQVRAEVGRLRIVAPPGVEVTVDFERVGVTGDTLPPLLEVQPDRPHQVSIQTLGSGKVRRSETKVDAPGPNEVTVSLALPEEPAPPPPPASIAPVRPVPPRPPPPVAILGIENTNVQLAICLVSAAGAGVLGSQGAIRILDSKSGTDDAIGIAMLSGTGFLLATAVVTGVVWMQNVSAKSKASTRVVPAPVVGGAGMNLVGTF